MKKAGVPAHALPILVACAAIVIIGVVDYRFEGIQLAPLITVPLLVIAFYVDVRIAVALAIIFAAIFGYSDYSPQTSRIEAVSFPIDGPALALAYCSIAVAAHLLRQESRRRARLQNDLVATREGELRAHAIARSDPLTGLMNRLGMDEFLENARLTQPGFAVLFLDLDGFKRINDIYGHSVGDEALRTTAKRIVSSVRTDDAVARIGGDEFIVFCRGKSSSAIAAKQVDKKIREAFSHPLTYESQSLSLSVSIGAAIYPQEGAEIETLLKLADQRMYEDKVRKTLSGLTSSVERKDAEAGKRGD